MSEINKYIYKVGPLTFCKVELQRINMATRDIVNLGSFCRKKSLSCRDRRAV